MEPMLSGNDYLNVRDGMRETGSLYRQVILVHRFTSFTGGAYNGVSPTRNTQDMVIPARVHSVTSKDILESGGFYVEGDIITDTEADIVGVSNVTGTIKQADQMTWNGQKYQVQGTPQPKFGAGGRVFTKTLWRRI